MWKVIVIVAFLILSSLSALIAVYKRLRVGIAILPQKGLIDQSVKIVLSNLSPRELITIDVEMKDAAKVVWRSSTVFEADAKGMVNVGKQAPSAGSYKVLDAAGLFWSMLPPEKHHHLFYSDMSEVSVLLSFLRGNKLFDQKTISRSFVLPDVVKKEVREKGLVGTVFYPKHKSNLPGVILVPGANGGIPETVAGLLASHGFAVFALGYFGVEGLPECLENIPLEYFQSAVRWFKALNEVDGNRVAMAGHSRGAELALIFAATFPAELNAVVAYVPSHVVNGGMPFANKPAWLESHLPVLPFIGGLTSQDLALTDSEDLKNAIESGALLKRHNGMKDPYRFSELFMLRDKAAHAKYEAAIIPVERMLCPLLIISGEADHVWPSYQSGQLIMARLDKMQSKIEREHLHFADAGHAFMIPNIPSADIASFDAAHDLWTNMGGTPEGNAKAASEAWAAVLAFLGKM